jgi:hypothetical protein
MPTNELARPPPWTADVDKPINFRITRRKSDEKQ